MTVEITIGDKANTEGRAAIVNGLNRFNASAVGSFERRLLTVLISDTTNGEPVGGLYGKTSLGIFTIDVFYVPEDLRGAGIGTRILQAAEREAISRGCATASVHTLSFQAPDFYVRNGYHEFGRVPCDRPGASRVYLRKHLSEELDIEG